jgi:hypothetical protein
MSKVLDFQQKLLTDPATRKAFSENPAKLLRELGVELPAGTRVPATIPLKEIEAQVRQVRIHLEEEKIDLGRVSPGDPAAVTRFLEDAIPLRTRDLRVARAVHAEALAPLGGRNPRDAATVVVVGAVVAAVVAVKVSVVGEVETAFANTIKEARGIEGLSRSALGFVLHGPNGIRVEGLDATAVVDIIKAVR